VPTDAMIEAVTLFARFEGVLLDPVYTGKAAAGLIALIREDRFRKGETVVFLHTGGTPALFAYRASFQEAASAAST
ncbi:MAG: D-cysteine desulfhydrase, partial [Hyphomicrobiales bacterium]|nr:D-cysteine desulfhydrase [Hyphomicrobiales bacterium]